MENRYSSMKVGVLGAGGVSLHSHLPVLVNMPNVTVEWICDKIDKKAYDLADRFGIKTVFTDLKQCTDVDVVLVAIPVGYRQNVMPEIFRRRWHAFCEKPFALTIKEYDDYLSKAKERGVQVGVGLCRRYAKPTVTAKKILDHGLFGPINRVFANEGSTVKRTGQEGDWYMSKPSIVGGGVLMETGSHLVDQVLSILGVQDFEIRECLQRQFKGLDFASTVTADILRDNQEKIECTIEISQIEDLCNGIFIEFPDYLLKVGLFFEDSLEILSRKGETICKFCLDEGAATIVRGVYLEWSDFLSQCALGKASIVSAYSARQTTAFIETCYKNAKII